MWKVLGLCVVGLITILSVIVIVGMLVAIFGSDDTETSHNPSSIKRDYNIYRTKDGKAYFIFRYVKSCFGYEIDIMSQPSYGYRKSSYHITHRLDSERSYCNCKICVFENKAPQTLTGAKKLSMAWAELTWNYIKTGVTLDEQIFRQ